MAEAKVNKKGPKFPVILVANDLLDGEVVFAGADGGWTPEPGKAAVANDGTQAAELEARGQAEFKANRIVDPYLVEVRIAENGMPVATHFREALRQKGPTVHRSMGKQAEYDVPA